MADPAEALGLAPERVGAPVLAGEQPSTRVAARTVRIMTAVGALAVGFVLTVGLSAGRTAAVEADARNAELIALIRARQDRTEALGAQLEALRLEVSAAQSAAAAGVPALQAEVAGVEAAAGLTALAGPGVRVTASDGEGDCVTGNPEDCQIQDTDLQRIVNALFAAGAEGVAINEQRLIATTAIRNAGGSVLANYTVLTSPYLVEAVGDPARLPLLFADSEVAVDFGFWIDAFGLGFALDEADDLTLPAYTGSIRLRDASAAGDLLGESATG